MKNIRNMVTGLPVASGNGGIFIMGITDLQKWILISNPPGGEIGNLVNGMAKGSENCIPKENEYCLFLVNSSSEATPLARDLSRYIGRATRDHSMVFMDYATFLCLSEQSNAPLFFLGAEAEISIIFDCPDQDQLLSAYPESKIPFELEKFRTVARMLGRRFGVTGGSSRLSDRIQSDPIRQIAVRIGQFMPRYWTKEGLHSGYGANSQDGLLSFIVPFQWFFWRNGNFDNLHKIMLCESLIVPYLKKDGSIILHPRTPLLMYLAGIQEEKWDEGISYQQFLDMHDWKHFRWSP